MLNEQQRQQLEQRLRSQRQQAEQQYQQYQQQLEQDIPMPALYVDMRGAVMVKYHAWAVVKNSGDPLPLHTAASNGDVALAMYHVKRGAWLARRRTKMARQRCRSPRPRVGKLHRTQVLLSSSAVPRSVPPITAFCMPSWGGRKPI